MKKAASDAGTKRGYDRRSAPRVWKKKTFEAAKPRLTSSMTNECICIFEANVLSPRTLSRMIALLDQSRAPTNYRVSLGGEPLGRWISSRRHQPLIRRLQNFYNSWLSLSAPFSTFATCSHFENISSEQRAFFCSLLFFRHKILRRLRCRRSARRRRSEAARRLSSFTSRKISTVKLCGWRCLPSWRTMRN